MSTVRDIMGVAGPTNIPSSLAAVMKSISAGVGPARKRKSFALERREVANLRDPDNPIPLKTVTGRQWKWTKCSSDSYVYHWDYRDPETTVYSGVKFNVAVELPNLDLIDPVWLEGNIFQKWPSFNLERLADLWELLRKYELRFVLVCDEAESLQVETLKEIYYAIVSHVSGKKCRYSAQADAARRKGLRARHLAVAQEGAERIGNVKREEKRLQVELKEVSSLIKTVETQWTQLTQHELVTTNSSPSNTVAYDAVVKQSSKIYNCECMQRIFPQCSTFRSVQILNFLNQVAALAEKEKSLAAFVRKTEASIKQQ